MKRVSVGKASLFAGTPSISASSKEQICVAGTGDFTEEELSFQ
jgi:hypothetical protein